MGKNFLPSRDSELAIWLDTYNSVVAAAPDLTGLSIEQAATLAAAVTAYSTALQKASARETRSPMNVEAKNEAKQAVIALVRSLVRINQAYPGMTNAKREQLGITVPDVSPSPVPVPDRAPEFDGLRAEGWTVRFRLHNGDSTRRAKPAGVKGANVFSYVGEHPPTEVAAWKFEGGITRTETSVVFPSTLAAGTKVWLTAFWFNTKAESGPAAVPVSTQINYGGLSMAA